MPRPHPGPSCLDPVPARAGNPSWPFCSERCRLLDLGRWLGEDYRIAGPPAGDGGARAAGDAGAGEDP